MPNTMDIKGDYAGKQKVLSVKKSLTYQNEPLIDYLPGSRV